MISPLLTKLAAWCKWILIAAAVWTFVLVLVARSTAKRPQHHVGNAATNEGAASDDIGPSIAALQQENERLRKELATLPDLRARSEQLRQEIASQEEKDHALWAAQSNSLQAAIETEQRELGELRQWSVGWQNARQREAALARLAEKAMETSDPADGEQAVSAQTLRQLALAQKRLTQMRHEFAQLDKSEKDNFRSRLAEVQAEWAAAYGKLSKDRVLYQWFPITNTTQDPKTVLFMRSILPDANGNVARVFLDGTVTYLKPPVQE